MNDLALSFQYLFIIISFLKSIVSLSNNKINRSVVWQNSGFLSVFMKHITIRQILMIIKVYCLACEPQDMNCMSFSFSLNKDSHVCRLKDTTVQTAKLFRIVPIYILIYFP